MVGIWVGQGESEDEASGNSHHLGENRMRIQVMVRITIRFSVSVR